VGLAVLLLVGVTLSVAGIAMWGVVRVHEDSSVALRGYRQLREVYEVGVYASQARQSLRLDVPNSAASVRMSQLALERLDLYAGGWLDESRFVEGELKEDLSQAALAPDDLQRGEALDRAMSRLATLASQVRSSVEAHQASADRERHLTLILISSFSGGFVLLAIFVGVLHYRSVTRPVDQLASMVRAFASGELHHRALIHGDGEFVQLARDLNHMADELQSLYHDLEQKVQEKSRELVRSERLASVGYLAAGVAHEINNPLGIIAAYAERALQRLRHGSMDASSSENAQQAFEIICEEAFRCKQITDRLLAMVRSGNAPRKPVSIAALAQEVVSILSGLPQFRHLNLSLKCGEEATALLADVNDAEIKQVLLNLLVNAAEAIENRDGRVDVAVNRDRESIEIVVADNGRGMKSDTLDRIFEPFFTQKKSQRAGTGLGLSISHAIIESHGGRLTAASEGAGKGSRFVVTLPIAKEAKHAGV
jgi:signal transduction histidine kinase